MESRFWHYDTVFDAVSLIRRYEDPSRSHIAGHHVNYFGVSIPIEVFPGILHEGVEMDPVPANWHADIAEFAAVLRAVELSGQHFNAVELGCGWGCWMNIAGITAKRSGRSVHVAGIEGDPNHIEFAKTVLGRNNFRDTEYSLYHGIAAGDSGVALFPKQEGNNWGLSPILGATDEQREEAENSGQYEILPMIPLDAVELPGARIDLLHIDIQGGEADLIENSLAAINASVAYMVVGTHSRQIEGRICEILLNQNWQIEIDRPAIHFLDRNPPLVSVDGVQGWRNLNLLPL